MTDHAIETKKSTPAFAWLSFFATVSGSNAAMLAANFPFGTSAVGGGISVHLILGIIQWFSVMGVVMGIAFLLSTEGYRSFAKIVLSINLLIFIGVLTVMNSAGG